ncbi:glycosyltransferase [Erwinia sp. MMLR14_017]|uniref:glycosyltransferase n=1 Tax=Erwinia sp. MMLR14_017 TaxID=3093842 RepID=UPI00299073AA|nr:glycosyltransferase [Erwinia sp. MMLR14_017]MDW8846004.1 glycosyltransferase [Erwinia sp. MMLR14_017]
MSHYAVISPPFYSHLHALEALAQELMLHGHKVTFIQQAGTMPWLGEKGPDLYTLKADPRPEKTLARTLHLASHPGGMAVLTLIADMARHTDMLCEVLPGVLNELAVDGLIVDQMEPAGGLVAEALGLPFVSVACALPVNRESGLPLPVMPFNYATSSRSQKIYHSSQRVYDWMMRSHNNVINRQARRFGLPSREGLHECLSPLAQISQTIPALDFPRKAPPENFYAVGPLRQKVTATASQFWPASPERPFVFASLGTLQGHRFRLFKTIAKACRSLDTQLLIAHCGGLNSAQSEQLQQAGATWVTDFADQPAVLKQAQAVITHGGLNTVADAVSTQTPIITVPLAFDQPGVAARVAWSGIGRRVSRFCTSETLADNLRTVLGDESYQQRLSAMQQQLAAAGGVTRAAEIASQALSPATEAIC